MIETTQSEAEHLTVGDRQIAVRRRGGGIPGLFWLGGYRSDMLGTKAAMLDAYGAQRGLAVTRFDYSGHGESGGEFEEGTISRWLEEAMSVFALMTEGPQIVVGSSMGGWLALLLNRRLRETGINRIAGLVLIAPAVDMTEDLMRQTFSDEERLALVREGRVEQPSEYSDEPDVITRTLIADGERHLMFGSPIETGCPVVILQGVKDTDVPAAHAIKLMSHLLTDEATLTLVPDGDHRLSREEDLRRLLAAIDRLAQDAA